MASVSGLTRIWATGPTSPNLDPGVTKWAQGWIAEIPTLQVLNYINNRNDTNQLALAERGVFPWTKGVVYKLGALSWDESNSLIYRAKVASPNTTLAPSANLAQWETSSIQISRAAYDAAAAAWASHIANVSNPHALTAAQVGTYTAVQIDAKVLVVTNAITAHTSIVSGNPHNTTAADVNAVPVTGGAYTGLVNHVYTQTLIGPPAYAGSLNATAAGVFIGKGAVARIGLNASSQPVAIDDAGVVTVLMTEASYAAAKLAAEPLYAVPQADCWLVAKNGLLLATSVATVSYVGTAGRSYTGKDNVTKTSVLNTPLLTPTGMQFNALTDTLTIPAANHILGFTRWSIFMDFRPSVINMDYLNIMQTGGYFRIYTVSGIMYVDYYLAGVKNTSIIPPNPTVAGDHKLALIYNGVSLVAYMDGVLVGTFAASTMSAFITHATNIQLGYPGTAGGIMYVRDFRTWNTALTAQQVSQL